MSDPLDGPWPPCPAHGQSALMRGFLGDVYCLLCDWWDMTSETETNEGEE